MKSIKDWVFSQMVSKSLVSSRPLSGSNGFFSEEFLEERGDTGSEDTANLATPPPALAITSHHSDSNRQNQPHSSPQHLSVEGFYGSSDRKRLDPLAKVEDLQIKFLRLLQRIGQSQANLVVAKVLYRLQLATLIGAGESGVKRADLRIDRARAIAEEQEASGLPELDFSFRILVLGKTGVGKSATINSIFDQAKAVTDAFQPATDCIREVVGTVSGIKVTFIDTPGLLPSSTSNVRKNRKIMLSVKKFIRKSPPDIVLYFERLDLINLGYSDSPLLKLITEVFGPAMWFSTILVMTHCSSDLPEGPNGFPVSYESYVTQCTELVQHHVQQAVSDTRLENPVLLVENHQSCRTNIMGRKILPNGQAWIPQFLLLCLCTKVLNDANRHLRFQHSIQLGPSSNTRLPSLPHLLSSFLRHHSSLDLSETDNEIDEILLSETEDVDEYDQLPPIRILTKSQFERLTSSQKKDYLDELDYRETLYLKKQLKEEAQGRRESKLSKEVTVADSNSFDDKEAYPEAVMLPDMAVPLSFDSDCPVHRYRCLVLSDRWLVRPVLDPHGWDHDVGFDGINLETNMELKRNIIASVSGQMSKDKQDFSIQSESAAVYLDPRGPNYFVGLDVQSTGKDLLYTVHSNMKMRNLKHNLTQCGFCVTSFRNKCCVAAKLEDTISIGNRLKFGMNVGRMTGFEQVAYGGSLGATLLGRDYPARKDSASLNMTLLSLNKEMVLSGSIQSNFQVGRGTRMSINANLNNRKMGQFCIKTSSSEHMEMALLAIFSIFRALSRRKEADSPCIEASGKE